MEVLREAELDIDTDLRVIVSILVLMEVLREALGGIMEGYFDHVSILVLMEVLREARAEGDCRATEERFQSLF